MPYAWASPVRKTLKLVLVTAHLIFCNMLNLQKHLLCNSKSSNNVLLWRTKNVSEILCDCRLNKNSSKIVMNVLIQNDY